LSSFSTVQFTLYVLGQVDITGFRIHYVESSSSTGASVDQVVSAYMDGAAPTIGSRSATDLTRLASPQLVYRSSSWPFGPPTPMKKGFAPLFFHLWFAASWVVF
jgi:hypothetical protein